MTTFSLLCEERDQTLREVRKPLPANRENQPSRETVTEGAKWSWSLRNLAVQDVTDVVGAGQRPPKAGDVALVEVKSIGHHTRLMTAHHGRLRLYATDRLACVFGNRYATDAFEAQLNTTDDLHMLTDAGMIGTVCSKHLNMKSPTRVEFLGYLADAAGERINLKRIARPSRPAGPHTPHVVLVVGSGMNSGKTTTAAKLTRALVARGVQVAACKVTGSVSYRDLSELRATGAHDVRDFSCYGFPSTFLATQTELLELFHNMLADASHVNPDVVIMEVADGMLQRETRMLLEHAEVRTCLLGILQSATCAPSALYSVEQLERLGHDILGVSGVMTSSPLFVQEFQRQSSIPVVSSAGNGNQIADLVVRELAQANQSRSTATAQSLMSIFKSEQNQKQSPDHGDPATSGPIRHAA